MKLAIEKLINDLNQELYSRFGLSCRKPIYKCVICRNKISLDDSMSDKGKRMICMKCASRNFETLNDAMIWTEGHE